MPYTVGLLKSVPKLSVFDGHQKPLPAIRGNVPSPFNLPAGCSFSERCDYSRDPVCTTKVPPLEAIGEQHSVRCARWRELSWE
ncbi:hypothetical protein L1889_01760 [Paenalcaligenes niemegkensis]|uniref:oligopeptide/dipeptide ABC transporter ATP-binding protein n=1 Tax=Paenalcaligenes niemegkensis TaxID=2895469 RepID=UPI001EE9947F|nr:oligopeptide/dipeptide ABC transporter ATP-binding protein [Paenalcaligenes niemegkensis]MCQ9615605.1 hypothetical protein [Paenalcaligenes niemegkensis]